MIIVLILYCLSSKVYSSFFLDVGLTVFSFDIVRGAHFSNLSTSPLAVIYPEFAPVNGWSPLRPLGLAAFSRRDVSCWLDDLRATLDLGYPVLLLMHYGPNASDPTDGHFRVVIGYTDTAFQLLDPWDREGQPRVLSLESAHMCALWNYSENNGVGVSYNPFFAAVAAPWRVTIDFSEDPTTASLAIAVSVTYPCPHAFAAECARYPAHDVVLTIQLPPSLQLSPTNTSSVSFATLLAGESVSLVWLATSDDTHPKPSVATAIRVVAQGVVKGAVPAMYWSNTSTLPAYSYSDVIGGRAELPY